jgi:hypothetical protein
MNYPHQQKYLKDRRKQWQKECINYSWSRCGTIATPRTGQALERRQQALLASEQGQAMLVD